MRSSLPQVMSALHLAISRPSPRPRTTPIAAALHRLARDRIGADGHLRPSSPPSDAATAPNPTPHPSGYVIGSPIPGSDPAPAVPPPTPAQLDSLAEFIADGRGSDGGGVLVITGAGCSTESNVPDYRGPGGAYSTGFKPMTHQAFMQSARNRSRYWARSYAGWERFSRVKPNSAHHGIAALQSCGAAGHVITQNVDRLHHAAGSPAGQVLELHGTTHEVVCMTCRAVTPREEIQRLLTRLNPGAAEAAALAGGEDERERLLRAGTSLPVPKDLREAGAGVIRPDGDVEIEQAEFEVPLCPGCGGILKPDVVFFGDSLPKYRADMALKLAENASKVLVVGSSLAVWSAFRLVKAAKDRSGGGAQVAIVNVGPTRADDLADLKLELRAGDAMAGVAERLS